MSHPTEEKFPVQTENFRKMIEHMYEVHLEKNKDYSPANIIVAGEVGVIIRIWDKFCRICNLMGIPFPAIGPDIETLLNKVIDKMKEDDPFKNELVGDLRNLINKSEFNFSNYGEKTPANEPLDDAWLDMANYSVIGFLKRRGTWGR